MKDWKLLFVILFILGGISVGAIDGRKTANFAGYVFSETLRSVSNTIAAFLGQGYREPEYDSPAPSSTPGTQGEDEQ